MSSNPILRFAEAGKTYPPQRTPLRQLWSHLRGHGRDSMGGYTALQNLSFEVYPGQSLGIVGLNGAGKSTLLQLAAGTLTPSHGQVHSSGRVAALLELGSGFNPEATGRENIYLYAATMGLSREQVEQRLDSIIEFSGLHDALDMPVKTYSSGMQVRLAFSVATSVDPDILIVDEALSVGDGVFAKRSFDRVMQLREKGTALLLCSHALFHVDLFCERTLWLDRGNICAFGPTTEIVPRYQEFLDSLNQVPGPASPQAQTEAHPEVAEGLLSAARPELVRLLRAEVSLDGVAGKELYGHSGQSHLAVDIHLQVSEQEPHPCAAVVISSDSGKIIGSSFSESGTIEAYNEQGHAHVRFDLPNIPLNKGRYRVGVYLLCKNMRYVYEWVDPFAHIELKASGSHQGAWLMPGDWSGQASDTMDA
ncbi:polysaccharide ABC transporter ATP-binding protein [Comamonas sp. w2-DMI]|uniref:ABC transporter ATP-binding protein n=1 Tax=Comamonas sp. w2-DMI TaxID=3126391 RepID=UPI0032E3F133